MYILTDENGFITKKINTTEKPACYSEAIEFAGMPGKGKNIDEYNADGTLKTLKERYDLGFVETPAGNEWNGEKFIISEVAEPEKTIDQLKAEKKEEIKNAFNDFETNGIEGGIDSATLGIKIQCANTDIDKVAKILQKYSCGGSSPDFYIGVDEIKQNITVDDFKNSYIEITEKWEEMFNKKHTLYAEIENAKTKEALNEIVW